MLKLTLKPGQYIDIGADIRVIFSGGSANNIHLLVEAPREINIARSGTKNGGKKLQGTAHFQRGAKGNRRNFKARKGCGYG